MSLKQVILYELKVLFKLFLAQYFLDCPENGGAVGASFDFNPAFEAVPVFIAHVLNQLSEQA